MDDETYAMIDKLAGIHEELIPIALAEVEQWDEGLLVAKENRSRIEYYFTLSPILPLYIINNISDIDIVTYLDADLYFYSNPKTIYQELGDKSILIVAHRFPQSLMDLNQYGKYNVQYQSFRNDEQGLSCLKKWRKQCLQWCYDRLEDGKFADQKYLDAWPELYDNLIVSNMKGVGVAPWNVGQYEINYQNGDLYVDDQKLVFFHFHAIKKIFLKFYTTRFSNYELKRSQKNLIYIYKAYLQELDKANNLFNLPSNFFNQEIRFNQSNFTQFFIQGLKGNLIFCFNWRYCGLDNEEE